MTDNKECYICKFGNYRNTYLNRIFCEKYQGYVEPSNNCIGFIKGGNKTFTRTTQNTANGCREYFIINENGHISGKTLYGGLVANEFEKQLINNGFKRVYQF